MRCPPRLYYLLTSPFLALAREKPCSGRGGNTPWGGCWSVVAPRAALFTTRFVLEQESYKPGMHSSERQLPDLTSLSENDSRHGRRLGSSGGYAA